ncbi:MAG: extracellular solute-binding protein [Clostridiales bacterium]|jgi:hypothetical protein|nr:extracellular solute-binding protein [Clostridiales bacterium]
MNKKNFLIALVAIFFTSVSVCANEINVTVEGEPVVFEGQGATIVDGRTLVPVRGVFERLGFTVSWNAETRVVRLLREDYDIYIGVDSPLFTINGQLHYLDVPAQIIDGRTMIPLRGVLTNIGLGVDWNVATSTVIVGRHTGGRIHEVRDFGGRTLTIGAWWQNPISAIAWHPHDRTTSSNYELEQMVWENARRVEEVFNVRFDVQVVQYEDFVSELAASVAVGEPFADVVYLDDWMQLMARYNYIQPWDSADLPSSDLLGERIYTQVAMRDTEHIWAINQNGIDAQAYGLGVNLDIIYANKLPNPVYLYEAGEWTWDAMLEIMRGATLDIDGDGILDQFGIAGQPGQIIQHLIGANDGIMVDSDFNYGFFHPNTVAALEFSQIIFNEFLWASEYGGIMDNGNWDRNFYCAYDEGHSALFVAIIWAFENRPPDFNYAFVPFPTGPDNTTGSTWLTGFRQGVSVPVGTEWDIADILIILEELWSWSGDQPNLLLETDGIEWLRENLPTEGDVQRAIHAGNTAVSDIGRVAGMYYWVLGNFAETFWNREMNVMQAIKFFYGPQQELLDEMFRQ